MTLTAKTITDDQIREILEDPTCTKVRRHLCRVALNDGPTYLKASVVRSARARCAEILNQRATLKTDSPEQ